MDGVAADDSWSHDLVSLSPESRAPTMPRLMTNSSKCRERTSRLGQIQENEVSAPPYQTHDKLESIRLEVDTMLHDGPGDKPNIPTGVDAPPSIIDKANGQELQSYESRVLALESEARFLDAATEQGILINLRRGLKEHIPFTAQDEALLVERQADYLLRCHTVG